MENKITWEMAKKIRREITIAIKANRIPGNVNKIKVKDIATRNNVTNQVVWNEYQEVIKAMGAN